MITGAHLLAFVLGGVVAYCVLRLVDAYREVSDDDLAPIPFRSLPPRSVPPVSGRERFMEEWERAMRVDVAKSIGVSMALHPHGGLAAVPEPPKLSLYDHTNEKEDA